MKTAQNTDRNLKTMGSKCMCITQNSIEYYIDKPIFNEDPFMLVYGKKGILSASTSIKEADIVDCESVGKVLVCTLNKSIFNSVVYETKFSGLKTNKICSITRKSTVGVLNPITRETEYPELTIISNLDCVFVNVTEVEKTYNYGTVSINSYVAFIPDKYLLKVKDEMSVDSKKYEITSISRIYNNISKCVVKEK